MKSTRTTQPYRRGARQGGSTLRAMLAGKPAFLPNPIDLKRQGAQRRSQLSQSALLTALAERNRR